jgi:hypothetical protein
MTGGHGPDKCIDAVGAESHATASFDALFDTAKAAVLLGTAVRTCCGQPSWPAAQAALFRCRASTAAFWTTFRSAPP